MKMLVMAASLLLTANVFAVKMAKVDVQKVLVSIKESSSIREKLKKEFDKKQKEVRDEEKAIVKAQEDFKKQSAVLNEKTRLKKQQELQQQFLALQQKMKKYQQEMGEMENKFKAPILQKITKVVQDISKKKGYDFTYEASTTPFLYSKGVTDITADVIKAYDSDKK